ncbi:MAG: adenylate/guanylate cyclase domain-containing protein [Gemmobacter sp.]
MSDTRTHRRLAAILAADVAGYSRLMGADEAGTLAAMHHVWTQVFNPAVAAHRGRVFKTMGDGALVEFASAVDAVDCAVAVQAGMAAMNAASGRAAMEFRIGINLGDVVSEGDDILGDGVNVAARLETQAPRNGILVSDSVHGQVRGKVAITFADAGDLALKNIAAPVRAWRWGEGQAATVAATDDLPSIAVLPFTNMSNDPEQEYFSDGIAEDVITDLSKIAGLMVIARNSSFAYKGKTVDIRAVGRDLGVTSVLEGSIRRAGNRVRITAQLIDARNGAHLWAERYDRDLTDIFAVQDEVTLQIVGALKVTLRPAERARLAETRAANVEAHDAFLQGRAAMMGAVKDGQAFHRAVTAFERAIQIDPAYSAPYAGLALCHVFDYLNRWTGAPDPLGLAATLAATALDKGPNDPFSHQVSGIVKSWQKDLEGAVAASEHALTLSPNFAPAHQSLGTQLIYLGRTEQGIGHIRRAMALEPGLAHTPQHFLALGELLMGHYDAAEAIFRDRIRQAPNTDFSRAFLAATLGHLGRTDEARAVWADLRAVNPKYSLADHLDRSPFRRAQDIARITDGLAKAGLPD